MIEIERQFVMTKYREIGFSERTSSVALTALNRLICLQLDASSVSRDGRSRSFGVRPYVLAVGTSLTSLVRGAVLRSAESFIRSRLFSLRRPLGPCEFIYFLSVVDVPCKLRATCSYEPLTRVLFIWEEKTGRN